MPSALDRPTFTAGGNISPATFVTQTNTADFTVLASNATTIPSGIAHDSTEEFPHSGGSAYAASAGKELTLRQAGEKALLLLAGTVEAGDMLKSDANGAGVVVAAFNAAGANIAWVGARALRGGVSGNKIEVMVVPPTPWIYT